MSAKKKSKKDILSKVKARKRGFTVTTVVANDVVYIARYTLPDGRTVTIDTKKAAIDLAPMVDFIGENFKLIDHEKGTTRVCKLYDIHDVDGQMVMGFKEVV